MGMRERLARLEQRKNPGLGLPELVTVPASGPERERVLAQIDRQRKRGHNSLAVPEGVDPLEILADALAP